ncbi:DUF3046 domain-containing protein [Microbacterium mitrae]|uniref:DUF3046 domain-containing protein n=1 Tax=Microbacterium mitrae TaxID=664640 RepID=A0A5C8HMJ2_9MICO|nr:DUF3046 domain-containing protein [Microbacterium mitrae]TXK04657.1 DUF3046 domain-containing protein [Microbacterium mitrae]
MRRSEFLRAVDGEFGGRAVSILQDLHLPAIGMTSTFALEAGIAPRDIWLALCAEMDVPQERWHGAGRIDRARR